MSDSYGSLEWFRNLSEADKAYASTYGRDNLIQKQKREAEAQQQQEQQPIEESEQHETEESEQQEETEEMEETETIEDPLLEEKQNQLEQKQRILDKIEKQVDIENAFAEIIAVPEWREVLGDYIQAIQFVISGYASYFTQLITKNGEKLDFDFQFYDKNGKKIERVNPEVAVQPVEGD